jgi:uncharacterized protein (TIGR02646 family)
MILLIKRPKPRVLEVNAQRWTTELLAIIDAGEDPSPTKKGRYNHQDIKSELLLETQEKCAYCESKLTHVTYGDIEHITPKSARPELSFEWLNLTVACDVCNTKKSNKEGLIDPYIPNPEDHFLFLGPMMFLKSENDAARIAHTVLDLNRTPLLERRKEKLDALNDRLSTIRNVADENARTLLHQTVIAEETGPSKEYAACARAFVRARYP